MIVQSIDKESFCLEIDHVSIFNIDNISSVSRLQELGFHCSEKIVEHKAQGTISTVFFFQNTYLELVHLVDINIAKEYAIANGIDLVTRCCWRQTGASPFKIGLRANPMFAWQKENLQNTDIDNYTDFSRDNLASIEEPMCFSIPNTLALTSWLDTSCPSHQQLISHKLEIEKLTHVSITTTSHKKLTNAVALLQDNDVVTLKKGNVPLLELEFDNAARKETIDVRPELPMIIRY
jgi:hypothetical protein